MVHTQRPIRELDGHNCLKWNLKAERVAGVLSPWKAIINLKKSAIFNDSLNSKAQGRVIVAYSQCR